MNTPDEMQNQTEVLIDYVSTYFPTTQRSG